MLRFPRVVVVLVGTVLERQSDNSPSPQVCSESNRCHGRTYKSQKPKQSKQKRHCLSNPILLDFFFFSFTFHPTYTEHSSVDPLADLPPFDSIQTTSSGLLGHPNLADTDRPSTTDSSLTQMARYHPL